MFLFFLAVASLACGSAAPVVPNIHTLSSDFSTSYAAALVHNSVNTTATVAANPLHDDVAGTFPTAASDAARITQKAVQRTAPAAKIFLLGNAPPGCAHHPATRFPGCPPGWKVKGPGWYPGWDHSWLLVSVNTTRFNTAALISAGTK